MGAEVMVAAQPKERPFTAEDLANVPDDGRRYEVVGGELIVSPSPSQRHQVVSANLHFQLKRYLQSTNTGLALAAPFDVHLGEHDIVQPDLLVVLKENIARVKEFGVAGSPDLMIEIISPSSLRVDYIRKAATYATAGVPEYWIVDPERETILAQSLKDGRYRPISSKEELIWSVHVPGLVIDPAEIFAVPEWMTFGRSR